MATSTFPSGSKWGIPELQRIGFELKPRSFPLATFPWKEFISNQEMDPCVKIEGRLKSMFGPQSEDTDQIDVIITKPFYRALEKFLELPMAVTSKGIYQTRSKPTLPESSPMTLPSSPPRTVISYPRDRDAITGVVPKVAAPSQAPFGHSILFDRESQEQLHQSYCSDQDNERSETERTPRPADGKRRRLSIGYQIRDSVSELDDITNPNQSGGWGVNVETNLESDQNLSRQSNTKNLPFTPTRSTRLPPMRSMEQLLSSSQSDLYEASSPFSQATISPLGPTELPQRDQAENNTNILFYLLLDCIFQELLNINSDNGLEIMVTYDTDNLVVAVGGQFIKTKPDLKVFLRRKNEAITLIDYEGKRLKPNMTPEEKFAQRICHMIGRANHNMASDATESRTVYLMTAQHTSVSILSCKIRRKWLLMAAEDDLAPLTRIAKRYVNEYGPVDLADPDERILFVQMLCRLLTHLVNISKFRDSKNNKNGKSSKDAENDKVDEDDNSDNNDNDDNDDKNDTK